MFGSRGARLELAGEFRVERRDGNVDRDAIPARQLGEQIEIARDEEVLRHDADRMAGALQYLENTAHNLSFALDRLALRLIRVEQAFGRAA